jgi:hypothetical protein
MAFSLPILLASIAVRAELTDEIVERAQESFESLIAQPPMSVDDLKVPAVGPADEEEVPELVKALSRRYGRNNPAVDWYVKWRLLLPLLKSPPEFIDKEINSLVRVYRRLPDSMPPRVISRSQAALLKKYLEVKDDKKDDKSGPNRGAKMVEEKYKYDEAVMLYNTVLRKAQEDFTRLLLRSGDPQVGRAIVYRLKKLTAKKDYSVLDLLDVIAAKSKEKESYIEPATARILMAEMMSMARRYKKAERFYVFNKMLIREMETSTVESELITLADTAGPLADRLKEISEAPPREEREEVEEEEKPVEPEKAEEAEKEEAPAEKGVEGKTEEKKPEKETEEKTKPEAVKPEGKKSDKDDKLPAPIF